MELSIYHQLSIALGLGLLVGFQREWAMIPMAGIRTFPLIAIFGVLAALLAERFSGWVVAAGLVSVAALVIFRNLMAGAKRGELDLGITSEVAALVMYAVGAAVGAGYALPAVFVAGIMAVLLQWKEPLHRFVERVRERELNAVMRFVLLSMVILPLLPDHGYGPYGVLNPFRVWLMVVLIVGISLAGYVASLLLGVRGGTLGAGVLGGFISSTATTVSYARASRTAPQKAPTATLVVMIASTIVFCRVLFEIAVVAPSVLAALAPPLMLMMGWMAVVTVVAFWVMRRKLSAPVERGDPPSNVVAAMVFGALYAVVLVAVAFAKENLGDRGLYLVAAVSGLTDMDAITLSSAQMVSNGNLESGTGWRMIAVGAIANLLFKGAIVAALADRRMLKLIAGVFGASLLGAGAVLFLWPH